MAAAGVDLGDGAAVAAWIDEFNRRPVDERDEVLGASPFDPRMRGSRGVPSGDKC
jgi:hypothetical protein